MELKPRPIIKYLGSKWNLAPRIIEMMPPHLTYVEPFGGSACVLLRKKPSRYEVYNDLNSHLITLFRVLQNRQQTKALLRRLRFTLFAEEEYRLATDKLNQNVFDDDVDHAWASYVAHNFSISGILNAAFPVVSNGLHFLKHHKKSILFFARRFRHVRITTRDAFDLIQKLDREDTVFYLDPPYVLKSRSATSSYIHDLDDEHHKRLVDLLPTLKSAVILSGYDNSIYAPLVDVHGWGVEKVLSLCRFGKKNCKGSQQRLEVLWYNQKVKDYLKRKTLPLFAMEER